MVKLQPKIIPSEPIDLGCKSPEPAALHVLTVEICIGIVQYQFPGPWASSEYRALRRHASKVSSDSVINARSIVKEIGYNRVATLEHRIAHGLRRDIDPPIFTTEKPARPAVINFIARYTGRVRFE